MIVRSDLLQLLTLLMLPATGCLGEYVVPSSSGTETEGDSSQCMTPEDLLCGDLCVDPGRNPNHCGACGNACSSEHACQRGECVDECDSGLALCSQSCVDVSSDASHCGECGEECDAGEQCIAGECENGCSEECSEAKEICLDAQCICRPGLEMCGGDCVDVDNDPENCGSCGSDCGGQPCGAASCQAGGCPVDTPDLCDGHCVDLKTDPLHCDECGRECQSGELCVDADCRDFKPAACGTCPCESSCDGWVCCFSEFAGSAVCINDDACP